MKPADDRCEEHGLYLYRTGFGWSCKLGCYYCDDPQKIKEGYIQQYKEELRDKILQKQQILKNNLDFDRNSISNSYLFEKIKSLEEILELLK